MEQLGISFSGGFNLNSIIILVVFAATALTIVALALPFMRGERFESRLRSVKERRRQLSQAQTTSFQSRTKLQDAQGKGIKALRSSELLLAGLKPIR